MCKKSKDLLKCVYIMVLHFAHYIASSVDCNFDIDVCGYRQLTSDDFDWTRQNGTTPSKNTGPNGDHTSGIGKSLLID